MVGDTFVSNANAQHKEEIEVNGSSRIRSSISSNKNVSTYVDDTKGWGGVQEASAEEDFVSRNGEEEDRVMRSVLFQMTVGNVHNKQLLNI